MEPTKGRVVYEIDRNMTHIHDGVGWVESTCQPTAAQVELALALAAWWSGESSTLPPRTAVVLIGHDVIVSSSIVGHEARSTAHHMATRAAVGMSFDGLDAVYVNDPRGRNLPRVVFP